MVPERGKCIVGVRGILEVGRPRRAVEAGGQIRRPVDDEAQMVLLGCVAIHASVVLRADKRAGVRRGHLLEVGVRGETKAVSNPRLAAADPRRIVCTERRRERRSNVE